MIRMNLCVDCTTPSGADERCSDCRAEVDESPAWRLKTRAPRDPVKRATSAVARRKTVSCAGGCGRLCWDNQGATSGRPIGERMCRDCRRAATEARRPLCPECGTRVKNARAKYCSLACFNVRPVAAKSPICADDDCERLRRPRSSFCNVCERKREDPARLRARWRAKNHRRRIQYRAAFDEVTTEYEHTLRAKTRRCPLCKVWMVGKPYLPTSKELDHIVPRHAGGTHTIGNVRIICRSCNGRRPKDGSDYSGPVTLWAEVPHGSARVAGAHPDSPPRGDGLRDGQGRRPAGEAVGGRLPRARVAADRGGVRA